MSAWVVRDEDLKPSNQERIVRARRLRRKGISRFVNGLGFLAGGLLAQYLHFNLIASLAYIFALGFEVLGLLILVASANEVNLATKEIQDERS